MLGRDENERGPSFRWRIGNHRPARPYDAWNMEPEARVRSPMSLGLGVWSMLRSRSLGHICVRVSTTSPRPSRQSVRRRLYSPQQLDMLPVMSGGSVERRAVIAITLSAVPLWTGKDAEKPRRVTRARETRPMDPMNLTFCRSVAAQRYVADSHPSKGSTDGARLSPQ